MNKVQRFLVADIGGTNSRFAAFTLLEDGELRLDETKWLETGKASSFEELLHNLDDGGFSLKIAHANIAVFAVAGPVTAGKFSTPPNIKWKVDLVQASSEFQINRGYLINDFVAQAYAAISKIGRKGQMVRQGVSEQDAAIAVVGVGTGLGKATLVPLVGGGYIANRSEGGHTNFGAETDEEIKLQKFLLNKLRVTYVEWEDVVSGRGFSHVHEFLTGKVLSPPQVAEQFTLQSKTLEFVSRFFGRITRNFVLENYCMGGVYLTGGIVAKNPLLVEHPAFLTEFARSRTHQELLAKIPIYQISDEETGLWGGAQFALSMI